MIGEKLKRIRMEKGLSLEGVSELTGVSKPMLAQIERAMSNPTVSTLWKIAEGLKVPFTAFIEEDDDVVKLVQKKNIAPIKEANDLYEVYSIFPMANGRPFEFYEIDLLPGCDYSASPHTPNVEEYIWVMEGAIKMAYNGEIYTLNSGEGMHFVADKPHRYINDCSKEAQIMMVIYYPQPS